MRYVHLGRTGLRVSRLCLGSMNFAGQIGEPESHAVLDRGLALDTELSAETLDELDRIFPPVGNGGPGPEAWAW